MQMLNKSLKDTKFTELLLKSVVRGLHSFQYLICKNVLYTTESDLHDFLYCKTRTEKMVNWKLK